ncbi:MAG: TldD/PmbA family protein, partial [Spirochaetales bacterium]|nr:TldD/PmbA family protein [Spirochaetales bacterium]
NSRRTEGGISARVFLNGGWGFASSPDLTDDSIGKVIRTAAGNARFMDSRLGNKPYQLPSIPGNSSKSFETQKPRKSQKELIDFAREVDAIIQGDCPGLRSRSVVLQGLDMEKSLITSDGAESYSYIPRTIFYIDLSMEKDGEPFELFEPMGGRGQFEDLFSQPAQLKDGILKTYEHLRAKSQGVYPQAGVRECVLDSYLAGVFAHEAIGHTTEADLVIGGSVAGEYLNKQVGSELVNMVDFAHTAFGETCPVPLYVDDEGTVARDAVLIEKGILKGFMHNRETALHFNTEPTGNAKAFRFSDEPLIRMRNTTVLPGESNLDDMIASIDDGYYLLRFNNGQADTTSEFMFGINLGYEIKNGKVGRAIRDTTISGVAFETLKTVTMISNDLSWSCGGMCGKKQPLPVGMGGPAIKCEVSIGGR